MKNLIILVVVAIAGYFAYQHFYISQSEDVVNAPSSDSSSISYIPPVPEECQSKQGEFENAVYSSDAPQTSFAQRNYARRSFISCLKEAGLSDQEINAAVSEIEERVKDWASADGGVPAVR